MDAQVENILKVVCDYHGIEREAVLSPARRLNIVRTKHQIAYFARKFTPYSLARIGNCLGIDHATVLHAVNSVCNQMETNKQYAMEIDELWPKIRAKMFNSPDPECEEVFMENDFYETDNV